MKKDSIPLTTALPAINSEQNVAALLQEELMAWIASKFGLHFPLERQPEIARMLALCAQQFGLADAAACAQWLLKGAPTDEQLNVLARYLTVGETYFFREYAVFERLRNTILPALWRGRAGAEQRLRVWCAACATGEEAYSLAILLDQCVPQNAGWDVSILATDINTMALQHAQRGVYREWSFRQAPSWLKRRYFKQLENGEYEIAAHLKAAVRFEPLNLAAPEYPPLLRYAGGLDLIFCRNVLMYFAPAQAEQTAARLYQCLQPEGWLVSGQAELSSSIFGAFRSLHFDDVVVYRRQEATEDNMLKWQLRRSGAEHVADSGNAVESPNAATTLPPVSATEQSASGNQPKTESPDSQSLPHNTAANLADTQTPVEAAQQQLLAEAKGRCEQALASNQLDPALHYQRAALAIEQGAEETAIKSLRNALFLDPDFVMAYVTWGELAERAGRQHEAARHFANAARLLQKRPRAELVKAGAGLTVSGLLETLRQKPSFGGNAPHV